MAPDLLTWSSTQKCVTTATCEAEYVALRDASKEAFFTRAVLGFLQPELSGMRVDIFGDTWRLRQDFGCCVCLPGMVKTTRACERTSDGALDLQAPPVLGLGKKRRLFRISNLLIRTNEGGCFSRSHGAIQL